MTITDLPDVTCSVDTCGYHHDGCQAPAINVGSDDACTTFLPLGVDGGLPKFVAHVGACQRTDCAHNDHALCGAESVLIGAGSGTAHCQTYTAA